jgi:hypothetical protein
MNLFYMASPAYGGWVTFTAHLALKHSWPVFRLKEKTENRMRPLGYGISYRNTRLSDISGACLITAIDSKNLHLLACFPSQTWLVIHDPTEITKKTLSVFQKFRLITIRQTVHDYIKEKYELDSVFLLHPFHSYPTSVEERTEAVSINRIDWDKYTSLVLAANQLGAEIKLFGSINRMYVHMKLKDLPFSDSYKGSFPKSFDALNNILSRAKFVVDMSQIKKDGGGSQYTFLEAIHHGCILVLHRKWVEGFESVFVDRKNCLIVSDEKELAEVLTQEWPGITEHARLLLEPHLAVDWGRLTTS